MRPNSLRVVRAAAKINPTGLLRAVARLSADYAEALIDVYAEVISGSKAWTIFDWDSVLEELDNDPRTLGEFVDSPAVRALIRAQETPNAAA